MARYTSGWIKFHREAWEKDLSQNVWVWGLWWALLSMATWKESKIIWDGKQRVLPPGSVVFGYRELALKWDCSTNTVSKWIHYLHDTGRIVLETCTRGSIATICNWDTYQSRDEEAQTPSEHEVNTERTPSEHEVNVNEEVKKKRKNTHRHYTAEFEELYALYPRHEGKAPGFKIYSKQIHTPADRERLKTAIQNFRQKKAGKDVEFLPYFSTFMGEWEDHLPGAQPSLALAQPLKTLADLRGDS